MTQPPTPPAQVSTHQPLAGEAYLSFLPQACLAVRAGNDACDACERSCPAQALAVDGDGPRLVADCLHCGRCAAACPSGALQGEGFMSVMPGAGYGPVEVECAKAATYAAKHALRVPCLGGLTPTLLLQWWLAAGRRPLMLVNRQWCDGCNAGHGGFAGQAALDQAFAWLQACGVAPERGPRIRLAPTPPSTMPTAIPMAAKAGPALSRRGFFRRVTTEVAQERPVAAVPSGPRARLRRESCALPARQAWLATLTTVAQLQGQSLPAQALPALTVSTACTDHGLCTGVCPTGALQRVEDEGSTALNFDAARCVSCHRCEQVCPEKALQLGGAGAAGNTTLRRTARRECIQCGNDFAAHRPGGLCARCSTSAELARSMFGMGIAEK